MDKMSFLKLDIMVKEVGIQLKYVNYFWRVPLNNNNDDEGVSTIEELV